MWRTMPKVGRGQWESSSGLRFSWKLISFFPFPATDYTPYLQPLPWIPLTDGIHWIHKWKPRVGDTIQLALNQPFPPYLMVSVHSIISFNILLKLHVLQKLLWSSHWRNEIDNSTITKNHPFHNLSRRALVVQGWAVVRLCTALGCNTVWWPAFASSILNHELLGGRGRDSGLPTSILSLYFLSSFVPY